MYHFRALARAEISLLGMALILDLTKRNVTAVATSIQTSMDNMDTSLKHDFVLAAISVIPAAILWIALDQLFLGLMLGMALFAAAEFGYPAYRAGTLDFTRAIEFATNLRTMIRTRVARRA